MSSFNFLRSYVRLLEQTEVPPRFAIWTGIAALLASLERRVWISQGVFNIYPNFFMILVAASGQKKSTPINLADKLLRRITPYPPNIISQKVSTEALISAIKKHEVRDSTRLMAESCGGIVIADELVTFLDRGALEKGLGPILTKLWDCSKFEYETISRGTEVVEGGYLSILGGTTIDLIRNSLPRDSIGGGFTSRSLFIYEDKIAPPVAWVEYDESLMELEEELVKYLSELAKLAGPVTVDKDAKTFYKQDYEQRYYNSPFRKHAALQNYENRRQSHLFKVAMALMVAEDPGLVLRREHIEGAKTILEEAEIHMPKVMDLIIASDTGAQGNLVYEFIHHETKSRKEGYVTRADLVRHFAHRLDSAEISKIMDTLLVSGRVKSSTAGSKLVYSTKGAI